MSQRPRPTGWPEWVETWVMPYLEESALWPVLIALLGHVVLLFAVMILAFARSLNPLAGFGVGLLVLGSVDLVRNERAAMGRLGRVTWTVVLTWLASLLTAWGLGSVGVL